MIRNARVKPDGDVRRGIGTRRRGLGLAAAVAAAGLAVSACSTTQLGAAAIAGSQRITSASLTSQVANLDKAYKADRAKGIKPQRNTNQQTQQVLTWMLLFRIYDRIASEHKINVTPAQAQQQLNSLNSTAKQSKVTLQEYVSAGGAVPPDLMPQLGRYFAILTVLEDRITGGKTPSTTAEETKLENQVAHYQCVAAKSLAVRVNPQFGVFDYGSYSVVTGTPKLAANPSPTPSTSAPVQNPPC